MPPDYHMHTPLCRHAVGEPTEYAAQAVKIGLSEIGFTEHAPMPEQDFDNWRMLEGEMDLYHEKLNQAEKDNPGINILRSLEIDYLPGYTEWIRDLAERYEWDYLIGSVHYLQDKWSFDHPDHRDSWDEKDLNSVWSEYYHRLIESVEIGVFNIIGHCDLVKVFGHRPDCGLASLWKPFLEVVKQKDIAIEINTGGIKKPCGEMYPEPGLLEMAADIGVGLTFGSDAHKPERVGENFREAVELAKRTGFTHYRKFSRGEFESVSF